MPGPIGEVAGWRADWAWSLPLIVSTVAVHAFGLGLPHQHVMLASERIVERRQVILRFAVVIAIAVLLVTLLHATEGFFRAAAYSY